MIYFITGICVGITFTMFTTYIEMTRGFRSHLEDLLLGKKSFRMKEGEETESEGSGGGDNSGAKSNLEKKIEIENQDLRGVVLSQADSADLEEIEERFVRDEWGVEAGEDEEPQAEI